MNMERLLPPSRRMKRPAQVAAGVLALTLTTSCSGSAEHTTTPTPPTSSTTQTEVKKPTDDFMIFSSGKKRHDGSVSYDLFKLDLATKRVVNLTNTPDANEMNPAISPDMKTLAYYSDQGKDKINNIWTLDLKDPTKRKRLTDSRSSNYDPAYLPNGMIVYKSNLDDGHGDIWKMGPRGEDKINLTPNTATEEWKPTPITNDLIALTSRSRPDTEGAANSDELLILDTKTGVLTPLTKNDVPDWYQAVSPDGKSLVFTSKEPGGHDRIYRMDSDGSNRQVISPDDETLGDCSDPSFNSSGSKIALVCNGGDDSYKIMQMDSDGTHIEKLFGQTGSNALAPIYGRKVA